MYNQADEMSKDVSIIVHMSLSRFTFCTYPQKKGFIANANYNDAKKRGNFNNSNYSICFLFLSSLISQDIKT